MKKKCLFNLEAFSGKKNKNYGLRWQKNQKMMAFNGKMKKKLFVRIGNAMFACEIAGCHASALQMHGTIANIAMDGICSGQFFWQERQTNQTKVDIFVIFWWGRLLRLGAFGRWLGWWCCLPFSWPSTFLLGGLLLGGLLLGGHRSTLGCTLGRLFRLLAQNHNTFRRS